MPTLRHRLGRAVRRHREAAGYSQESLGDACGRHRTFIGQVERGEINVSLDNIALIARTLGVPVSQLFIEAEREGATAPDSGPLTPGPA